MEIEAVRVAISDDFFNSQNWVVMPTGQVKDKDGREVYKRGYVHILQKLAKS